MLRILFFYQKTNYCFIIPLEEEHALYDVDAVAFKKVL